MLHDEIDGIPTLSATETLVNSLGCGNTERGRLLIVERAIAPQVGTLLFQVYKIAHHLLYSGGFKDLRYGFLRDQGMLN